MGGTATSRGSAPTAARRCVELAPARTLRRLPSFSTGLFHHGDPGADRAELARALQRITAAGWRLTGASDHLVSEALYLQRPRGQRHRDLPRPPARRVAARGGQLRMATLPLDLDGVLAELRGRATRPGHGMPAGTQLGHVHLQVARPPGAARLLRRRARPRRDGALATRARCSSRPAATTTTSGSTPGRRRARRRRRTARWGSTASSSCCPDEDERDAAAARVGETGDPAPTDDGVLATDPAGNHVLLTTRG